MYSIKIANIILIVYILFITTSIQSNALARSEFHVNSYKQECQVNHGADRDDEIFDNRQNGNHDDSSQNISNVNSRASQKLDSIGIFQLVFPKNDSTLFNNKPKFVWTSVSKQSKSYAQSISYDLWISEHPNFDNAQIISGIIDTSYTSEPLSLGTTYFWKVLAKNSIGDSIWSEQQDWGFFINFWISNVKEKTIEKITEFQLLTNYPNPFNSTTQIPYIIPLTNHLQRIKIAIYNLSGQEVRLILNSGQNPGTHTVTWDGKNSLREIVPSGVYLCVLESGSSMQIRKIVFVR